MQPDPVKQAESDHQADHQSVPQPDRQSALKRDADGDRERPVSPRTDGRLRRWLLGLFGLAALSGALLSYALETINVPPRRLPEYIVHRASGHNPTIVATGAWLADTLMAQDRGVPRSMPPLRLRLGAQPEAVTPTAAQRQVAVASISQALQAIDHAQPGDVITFAPGRYRFTGSAIEIGSPGTLDRPITVRAAQPDTVQLEFDMTEGFRVAAPYWHFENLKIDGVCRDHGACEHAFHVVGKASHFMARNNTITNFNSHFKINAERGNAPDDGLIDGNTLTNDSVRETGNPVTVIDLVAASRWTIRKNLLADFFKGQADQISYGAFAKGGGSQNLFENNIVLCEYQLHPAGQRVGLSLGGGGTGAAYCRDKRCITEQSDSTIRGNLIASCSDDGIYLNAAATSTILHNTLIDTGGISVRYPQSSADIEGNLVDGKIRMRNEALLRMKDNLDTSMTRLYLGSHPVRDLFSGAAAGTFGGQIPRRAAGTPASGAPDLCGTPSSGPHAYGAFDRFADCLR